MHIPPFDNKNKPIVDIEDSRVPLNYFNIVKLNKDQSFEYQTPGYETCIVPATGTINVEIEGIKVESLGTRTVDVWDGEPEGVYVPSNTKAQFTSLVDNSEIFIAGANGMVGTAVSEKLLKSSKVDELTSSTREDTDLFSFKQTIYLITLIKI